MSLWHDAWSPLGSLAAALPAAFSHCLAPNATLAEAVRGGSVAIPLTHRVTAQAAAELVYLHSHLRALRLAPGADHRIVALGTSEEFRASDVYQALHASGCIVPHQDINWTNFAPPKVRVFFWILRLGRTRTRAHLFHIGCVSSPHCPFCPGQLEDLHHLFVCCPHLQEVWSRTSPGLRLPADADVTSLLEGLFAHLPDMHPSARNTVALAILWSVWKSRNSMVFDNDVLSAARIVSLVTSHLRLWVVRAPRRIDVGALLSWCDSIT